MCKLRPLTLFIYGLTVTILAFIARSTEQLLILTIINSPVGIILGIRRRLTSLIALFLIGLIGLFTNALIFSNNGVPLIDIHLLVIREGAVTSFLNVTLRLLVILGATLIFITQTNARSLIKSLEEELGLSKDIAYALAVGLRMLSILERDAGEIRLVRAERGFRKYPITPADFGSFLRPLLSLGLERAIWIGIATELRGFAQRSPKRVGLRVGLKDLAVYLVLILQCVAIFIIH